MKKTLRTAYALISVFLLLSQLMIPVLASTNTASTYLSDEMYEKLSIIYNEAESFSVDRKALENAYVGSPISAYELVGGHAEILPSVFYPVISGSDILFFIIDNDGALTVFVDVEGSFTSGLSEVSDTNERVALLYDSTGCYAVSNSTARKITTFGQEIAYRDSFTDANQVAACVASENLILSTVSPKARIQRQRLTTVNNLSTLSVNREITDVSLYVSFVSQLINGNSSNICWAASIACIGNYLTDYSYTAVEVAQMFFSDHDYNHGVGIPNIGAAMYQSYGVYYRYYAQSAPDDSLLITNLNAGYPVYSSWSWMYNNQYGSHATVIRGIQQSTDCVFLMDPEYGFYVADRSSDTYSYTNVNGLVLTLDGYCSMLLG